ncbi:MAG: DUF5050 domain-containing protein, partial [Candidatus Hydromicrobium sp.]
EQEATAGEEELESLEPPESGFEKDDEKNENKIDPEKISAIEIYLDGDKNNGIPLGEATYGMSSKEAFMIYSDKGADSGYILVLDNEEYTFEPGSTHYLYVYALIPKYGWNCTREKIIIPGETDFDENIRLSIDNPSHNEIIKEADKANMWVSGWSADFNFLDTTGIDRIEIYLNGPRGFGEFLGAANYGTERQDVATAYGNANYTNSGYSLNFDASGLEAGSENTLYVYSFSTSGTYYLAMRDIKMEGEEKESNAIISVDANLNDQSLEISGWAINKNEILEGKPRNLDVEYSTKKIVFVSSKDGNEDIFSMNLDGSELTQLTDYPGKDAYPAVSPDGRKIAYTSDINGIWQLMVMNWDGTEKMQLTQNPWRSGYPNWSFDGRFIFFEVFQDGDWEIYRVNSNGSNMKRLTLNPSVYDWHPFGHPFQYKVIYESGTVGNEDLYLMDYDGKNIKRISSINMRKRVPTISVDGKIIAFMGYEGENSFIYIMDSNGENIRKLTGSLVNCGHPSISPDNVYITFQASVNGQDEIFIMNIDGSNQIPLTNIPGNDWDPVFMYQTP